jgi:hypothetical protein
VKEVLCQTFVQDVTILVFVSIPAKKDVFKVERARATGMLTRVKK